MVEKKWIAIGLAVILVIVGAFLFLQTKPEVSEKERYEIPDIRDVLGPAGPEQVLQAYFMALKEKRWDDAERMLTKETILFLRRHGVVTHEDWAEGGWCFPAGIPDERVIGLEIIEVIYIEEDKAYILYKEAPFIHVEEIRAERVNGEWKLAFP